MRQLILPDDWKGGPTCLIEGGKAHYMARVLRLGRGDSLPGRDREGRAWKCTVLEAGQGRILLSVLPMADSQQVEPALGRGAAAEQPRIVLVQGLPAGTKMDLVIRQATEAGVSAVFPLLCARALPRVGEGAGPRLSRWQRIVKEAPQQSGSRVRTEIVEPLGLTELAAALAAHGLRTGDPRILLHEAPLAQSSMHGYLTGAPEAVVLCVGPEGGLTQAEQSALLAADFQTVRVGTTTLRIETAAISMLAAIRGICA